MFDFCMLSFSKENLILEFLFEVSTMNNTVTLIRVFVLIYLIHSTFHV